MASARSGSSRSSRRAAPSRTNASATRASAKQDSISSHVVDIFLTSSGVPKRLAPPDARVSPHENRDFVNCGTFTAFESRP